MTEWPTLSQSKSMDCFPVLVTPSMAQEKSASAKFERQRPIRKSNIERLAAEMRSETFIPGTQINFCVLPDGTEFLVNGQPTLNAIVVSGKPQHLVATYVRVDDEDQAGRIYAILDTQAARTWGDALRAVGRPNADRSVIAALTIIEAK